MIPILYDTNETSFTSNGLGRLRDCIECKVTEERNGVYEADFQYPVTGANFDRIKVGRIIGVTHNESEDIQPFDIVSYEKPINGIVTFHCTHISYRQSYMTVTGSNINSLADAFTLLGNAEPTNPFTYQTDKTSSAYMSGADGKPKSVRSLLGGTEGSILDTYGGEYEWDKFRVILHSSRGETRPFSIRYGVNMLEYNEDFDTQGSYSSCIPYWTDGTETVVGDRQLTTGVTIANRGECVPLDVSDKFESKPTKAEVEAMGLSVMNSRNAYNPTQTIHVEFARLQDVPDYENFKRLYQCNLCDTINVVFPDYKSTGRFKIVKAVWDVLKDRYESMELGDLSISLAEALGIDNGKSDSKVASEWTLIKTVTGNVSSTIDLSDYSEVLVTCKLTVTGGSNPRSASTNIPVAILSSNYQEWSVGFSPSVYTATFGALFRMSLTNFTPQWAYANGSDYSAAAQWNIYGLKVKNLVEGGGGGTTNYEALTNKPQIEGVTLIGNKSFSDLSLNALTNIEIEELLEGSE